MFIDYSQNALSLFSLNNEQRLIIDLRFSTTPSINDASSAPTNYALTSHYNIAPQVQPLNSQPIQNPHQLGAPGFYSSQNYNTSNYGGGAPNQPNIPVGNVQPSMNSQAFGMP